MKKLVLDVADDRVVEEQLPGSWGAVVRREIRLGAFRDDRAAKKEIPVADERVLEIQGADGLTRWCRADDLPERDGVLRVDEFLHQSARSGAGDALVSLLELAPVESLVADGVIATVKALERRRVPASLLRRLHADDRALREPERWSEVKDPPAGRYLLLLHGTFSSARDSFGDLAGTDAWSAIARRYPERVLAYDGPTMSQSPVRDAIEVLTRFPEGREVALDLISYSRGGLIGELLAAPPDPLDDAAIEHLARRHDGDAWREAVVALNAELVALRAAHRARRVTVAQHTRVATPLGGTPLAGRRLDTWLSVILSALQLIPGVGSSPFYGFVKRTALEIIARRLSAADLPGLAAMDPDGPLVRALALRGPSPARTQVIAGDVEGEGLLSRVAVAATDLFFREDHDIVVPTRSSLVDRAALHPQDLSLRGRDVHHWGYFRDQRVRDAIERFGRGGSDEVTRGAALALGRDLFDFGAPYRDPPPRPGSDIVFVLPGILGSELYARDGARVRRVWPDLRAIVAGDMELLRSVPGSVEAARPVGAFYDRLIRSLGERFEVRSFHYDWRLGFDALSQQLGARLDELLRDEERFGRTRKIHFVCHSMGGVVAMETFRAGRRLGAREGRLILLGTPTRGAVDPLLVLGGASGLVDLLAAADLRHSKAELTEILRGFSGLFQMTADRARGADNWREILAKIGVRRPVVNDAEAFWGRRAALRREDLPETIFVAGIGENTPDAAEISESGEIAPRYEPRGRGDGTVLWDDGFDRSLMRERYWVDAEHSRIPREIDPEAIVDLIRHGRTERLLREEPEQSVSSLLLRGDPRAAAGAEAAAPNSRLPTEDELVAGRRPGKRRARAVSSEGPLRAKVVHGSLLYEQETIVLCVFEGDAPTELALTLDRALDGALERAFLLRTWPARFGAWSVVTARDVRDLDDDPLRKVLLVNLGRAWELTRRRLREALTAAMRAWVLEATSGATQVRRVVLCAALVGADGREPIGLEEAVVTWVEAAVQANRALRASGLTARLDELRFVEPYRDIAARAAHAIADLRDWAAVAVSEAEFSAQKTLAQSEGYFGDRPASLGTWETWERISIDGRTRPDGELLLRVELGSGQAARFKDPVSIPREVRDELGGTGMARRADLLDAEALLRAISGRRLRERTQAGAGLVLELGREAARLPWEALLADHLQDEQEVRDGVVRIRVARRQVTDILPATGQGVLVFGDPGRRVPAGLPAAAAEASSVRALFAASRALRWEVSGGEAWSVSEVLRALTARAYRVLHIASHGRVDGRGRAEVYLGDGCWRGPELIDQLEALPQLVFLNCCYLGAMPADPAGFAGSIAEGFLRRGVRAMVVAGWAVADEAARTFALTFYDALFQGENFGRAVRLARRETRLRYPGVNSWAAFQCYGEPHFVLVPEARLDRRLSGFERCADSDEAVDVLVALGGDARTLPPHRRGELRGALERNLAAWDRRITQDGEVIYRAAMLWLDLDALDEALKLFQQLIQSSGPDQVIRNRGRSYRTFRARGSEWAANTMSRLARRKARAEDPAVRAEAVALAVNAQQVMAALSTLWPDDAVVRNVYGHVMFRVGALLPALGKAWLVVVQNYFDEAARANTEASDLAQDRHALDAALLRVARVGALSAEDVARLGVVRRERRDGNDTFSRRPRGELELIAWIEAGSREALRRGVGTLRALLTRSASRMWRDVVVEFFEDLREVTSRAPSKTLQQERLMVACASLLAALRDDGEAAMPRALRAAADDLVDAVMVHVATKGERARFDALAAEGEAEGSAWAWLQRAVAQSETSGAAIVTLQGVTAAQVAALRRAGVLVEQATARARAQKAAEDAEEGARARAEALVLRDGEGAGEGERVAFLAAGASLDEVTASVEALPAKVVEVNVQKRRIRVRGAPASLAALSAVPGIARVEPAPRWEFFNDQARAIVGADPPASVGARHWEFKLSNGDVVILDGTGEVVAVADSGMDGDHPDLQGCADVLALRDDSQLDEKIDNVGHGTHVTGTVLGRGVASKGQFRGVAPGARAVVQRIAARVGSKVALSGLPLDLGTLLKEAYDAGARVVNWSWGAYASGTYTAYAEDVDAFVAEHEDLVVVIAAGNTGSAADRKDPFDPRRAARGFVDWHSVNSPATAKNAVVVGASRSRRVEVGRKGAHGQYWPQDFPDPPIAREPVGGDPNGLAGFSSRGPLRAGGIRPDLVAPGTNIVSTRSGGVSDLEFWAPVPGHPKYAVLGGTSMATPVVAGCALLVRQYYRNVRGHDRPTAALVKATLCGGAAWLRGPDALADRDVRPNPHQGFGRVDLPGAIPVQGDFELLFRDVPTDGLAASHDAEYARSVFQEKDQARVYRVKARTGRSLRATLCFTDVAGRGLQNVLHLRVVREGRVWLENEGISESRVQPDFPPLDGKNTVKVVEVSTPEEGEYELVVWCSELKTKRQGYALVVTGALDGQMVMA